MSPIMGSVRLHAASHTYENTRLLHVQDMTLSLLFIGVYLENHFENADILLCLFNFVNLFRNVRVFLTGKLACIIFRFSCYSILKFEG